MLHPQASIYADNVVSRTWSSGRWYPHPTPPHPNLRWHFVGVGWGGVGISTSWRPRPWYYVVSIYARLRMQHVTTLTLRWGGVGWGGDINVLTTTSLILRCQHICSLEDATCHYVDTSLGWGGVGWGYQRRWEHGLCDQTSAPKTRT